MKEDNSTWWENATLYVHQRKPFGEKHTLANAAYKLEDRGPHDNDFSGAPKYLWFWPIVILLAFYFSYWFWYGWVQLPGLIDWELLNNMTWGAVAGMCLLAIGFVSIFIDMHKGISSAYKYFLMLTVRFIGAKGLIREELRISKSLELWNPRDKKRADEEIAQIEEAINATEEGKADLKKANEEVDVRLVEIRKMIADLKPIPALTTPDDGDDILGGFIVDGKRFGSIRDIKSIMDSIHGKLKLPKVKDHLAESLELRRRFVRIAKALDLPFFVTLLLCERDIYPLVISDLPLFGGTVKGKSEFILHTLPIRSWAAYAARTVHNVALGSCVHVGDYTHYEMKREELSYTGRAEENIKFAPIFYITDSDGQTSNIINDIKHKENKHVPDTIDVLQSSLTYTQSIADELFEGRKLITGRLDRKTKSSEEMKREYEADSKSTVKRAVEISLRTGEVRSGLKSGIINLFSNKAVKMIFYLCVLLMTFFFISWIAFKFGDISVPWFEDGGNSTVPEEEGVWGGIKLLVEVSRTL